jgi:hypothetical protein
MTANPTSTATLFAMCAIRRDHSPSRTLSPARSKARKKIHIRIVFLEAQEILTSSLLSFVLIAFQSYREEELVYTFPADQ